MAEEIELSQLDLRYESYRLKEPIAEKRLLGVISERGIEEALEGVAVHGCNAVLNGFKRYRCAKKLGIGKVPYLSLGEGEVGGIVTLLCTSKDKSLNILEQARFVDELKNVHNMSIAQIAEELSRSNSWVSMRVGLMDEMSEKIRELLFKGAFPVYSWIYTVRPFMRMKGVKLEEVEQFVEAVSGKKLSVREVEHLAYGFFEGPESFRSEVLSGNLALPLAQIQEATENCDDCSKFERAFLNDLEAAQKYIQRVMSKCQNSRLESRAFYSQSNILTTRLLSCRQTFFHNLKELHDRSGQA